MRAARLVLFAVLGVAASLGTASAQDDSPQNLAWVYFGTYTQGDSQGIYVGQLDTASGDLKLLGVAAETKNPSFLAVHPSRRFLYSVGEIGDFQGKRTGAVNAFQIDPQTGLLTLLNQQSSGGGGPCHVTVDRAGRNVLVANYGGGSVAVLPIGGDGRLGEATAFIQHRGSSVNARRQGEPHAHSINLDAANRFAFVADLGLDKVLIYRFDADRGTLTAGDPAWATVTPGSGPRHFAFHPSGKFAYVINELASTVTAFAYDNGVLTDVQTVSTLPDDFQGDNTTAEVQVHPSGKFVYGSNRGHDSIAVFRVAADTGRLQRIENEPSGGKTPRNFGLDPTGRFLLAAHQNSGNVVVFRIDQETGALSPTGTEVRVPAAVCVKMFWMPSPISPAQ